MTNDERDEKLEEIARGCLGLSLKLISDNRTSHNITRVDLKQALQLAFKLGKEKGNE